LLAACAGLPQLVTVITRLRLDAALYDPAPPRTPGTRGAPRKKGARQPALTHRVADPATGWEEITVRWYGRTTRVVKIATGTAVWYHSGTPVVPLRWVLIADPLGKFVPQALLSTNVTLTAQQIVDWQSPLKKPAPTWALRRNGSDRTSPSCARRRRCWACSRW